MNRLIQKKEQIVLHMTYYESNNADETFELAQKLGRMAQPGQVYALDGDLGAGKTLFCQGFAEGLDVCEPVNSPTFTILQEYTTGRLPLYHFDVYRIEDPVELEETGYGDYFFGEGVCLVEWAEQIRELLPEDTVHIRIEKDPQRGMDYRRITISGLPADITGDDK